MQPARYMGLCIIQISVQPSTEHHTIVKKIAIIIKNCKPRDDTGIQAFRFQSQWDVSWASNVKDERLGHCLAMLAPSWPPTTRQFNMPVQYENTATSTPTTGHACKAVAEAYTAFLFPPTAMCELVLNMRAPKSGAHLIRARTVDSVDSSGNVSGCNLNYH